LIWCYEKSGEYTVRSGYRFALSITRHLPNAPVSPPGNAALKAEIWKQNILPKIQHFFWRFMSNALGTTTRLSTKRVHMDLT
ncbi:hypothetical protein, partial [Pseudomonas poae]|uniref:hypothetical protein n=1 Tax=Pseudomonas poae TaxID=200451 RepID=UPI0034D5B877